MELIVNDNAKLYFFAFKNPVVSLLPYHPENGEMNEFKRFMFAREAFSSKELGRNRIFFNPRQPQETKSHRLELVNNITFK